MDRNLKTDPMAKIKLYNQTAAFLLVVATHSAAQTVPADSTTVFPTKVRHRSGWEEVAALPGKVVYTPFFGLFYLRGQLVTAVWERRVIDRARELLTTADGRAGVRPLSNTSLGSGVLLFYKADGANVELVSTLGRGGIK
jgi:hypothetical protein